MAECLEVVETVEEAAARTGPTQMHLAFAEDVFDRLSALSEGDGIINKEDLIKAHGGDFKAVHIGFQFSRPDLACCVPAALRKDSDPARLPY